MGSCEITKNIVENKARMYFTSDGLIIEANVEPSGVKVVYDGKPRIKEASVFREEVRVKHKKDSFYQAAKEERLTNNHNVVMTGRGVGRSYQTALYMLDDPKVTTLVRDIQQKNNLMGVLESIIGKQDDRYKHVRDRIITFGNWENLHLPIGYPCDYKNCILHIDNVEHYLAYKLNRPVNSFTTGHTAVSGFTHEFDKAEEI